MVVSSFVLLLPLLLLLFIDRSGRVEVCGWRGYLTLVPHVAWYAQHNIAFLIPDDSSHFDNVTTMNILLETATTNGAGGSAFFFAWMGVATGLVFANLGSAYGTAKAGVGLMSMGVMNPGAVMKNVLPIILAAVLGIYGLIVAIIISSNGTLSTYLSIYPTVWHSLSSFSPYLTRTVFSVSNTFFTS